MGRTLPTLGALGALALAASLGFWAAEATPDNAAVVTAGGSPKAQALQIAAGEGTGRPVVVELYTSQGCSSCPPADAMLGELAQEPGVLALSFHVDYWDYIGWKDPFANSQYTERQRDYAARLGLRYVYTPQMVVDGRHDAVGSNRRAVTRAIADSAKTQPAVTVSLVHNNGGEAVLSAGEAPKDGATVWLVTFDDAHATKVARGENGGQQLTNVNVVRELRPLGSWTGAAKTFPLDFAAARGEGRGGCAVIVQQGRGGPIIGAAMIDLDSTS